MSPAPASGPLVGLRVIESSLLGPAAITTPLADLGADVIKVESPQGDYVREMTWPIVEGVSLLHLHINRGKHSVMLDLEARGRRGVQRPRPGRRRRGRGDAARLARAARPRLRAPPGGQPADRVLHDLGLRHDRPYQDLPAHGIAYDTWAGIVTPAYDDEGFCYIPEHASIGIHAGPLFGALGILAGVIRARATGEGCQMEIAQSDAAAYMDWYRIETWRAYERPESEVTGNASDNYERRAPGTAGMREGVRYQIYESTDGHVLFMASEQAFWKNFCEGVGRMDLFERWPGKQYADHARNNRELQAELREIFKTKTSAEWIAFGDEHNTPIAPVNTPKTIADDPQFRDRFPWIPAARLGADQLPLPVQVLGEELPEPTRAPTVGEHTDEVLTDVLGYDATRIAALRESGALG